MPRRDSRSIARAAPAACLLIAFAAAGGCNIVGFGGALVESYKRSSTHSVAEEYDGLRGRSFAVIVTSDRMLQGSHPTLLPRLTSRITQRLVEQQTLIGATAFVPPMTLLEFQLSNPNWVAWGYDRLAEELGVERLIVVELFDYRLHEIGNEYLWDGLAAARVGVVESDGLGSGDFVFSKEIQVRYPNQTGLGPQDMRLNQVQGMLENRFIDRVTWLFYKHEEPYYPEY
jgi:hypothetical protein